MTPPTAGDDYRAALSLAKTHRPNYVTEGQWHPDPEKRTLRTRVKCDGATCDFYAQDPSWYAVMDRHAEHVAEVLQDHLVRERAALAAPLLALLDQAQSSPDQHGDHDLRACVSVSDLRAVLVAFGVDAGS